MSALAQFTRLGLGKFKVAHLLAKDSALGRRQCHNKVKEIVLKEIEVYEKYLKRDPPIWHGYGFDQYSQSQDRAMMHVSMFGLVTVLLVVGGTLLAYRPDSQLSSWAKREAFLQLRYREENGLPLIDPNVVDPAKIVLPSDEELGDVEIII